MVDLRREPSLDSACKRNHNLSQPRLPTTGTAQVDAGTLDVLVTGSPTAPVAVVNRLTPGGGWKRHGAVQHLSRPGVPPRLYRPAQPGQRLEHILLAPTAVRTGPHDGPDRDRRCTGMA